MFKLVKKWTAGNHVHSAVGISGFNGNSGTYAYDTSANHTFNFDMVTVSYDKGSGKVALTKGAFYEEVKTPYQLVDSLGDIIGSVIQEGADIQLFKAMISEKLKEVIDEFQVGGNK